MKSDEKKFITFVALHFLVKIEQNEKKLQQLLCRCTYYILDRHTTLMRSYFFFCYDIVNNRFLRFRL